MGRNAVRIRAGRLVDGADDTPWNHGFNLDTHAEGVMPGPLLLSSRGGGGVRMARIGINA